ncbi:MAG: hypothetical protein K2O78_09880 [Muribaculaceae bacterium]|nr:hypothetical protein [Muribaculaceae bacterium]
MTSLTCKYIIPTALAIAAGLPAAAADVTTLYRMDLSRGTWPADVEVANLNGVLPAADAYKRVYTPDGWSIDRYGDRGYVALSPTYTGDPDASCAAALTLPARTVEKGEWLGWEALSAYRGCPESYRVEAVPTDGGAPVLLAEVAEEDFAWRLRMVSLDGVAGREVAVRFTATSTRGYVLALSDVRVLSGFDRWLEVADATPRWQGSADDVPRLSLDVTLHGASAEDTAFVCTFTGADGSVARAEVRADGVWSDGERRGIAVDLPAEVWPAVDYTVLPNEATAMDAAGGATAGHTYVSTFARRVMVDKGTGMWCVNCPAGEVAVDGLRDELGDALITVNTHVNDALANAAYWSSLKWYDVPRMMLNRVEATAGSNVKAFADYYDVPAEFGVSVMSVEEAQPGAIHGVVNVRVARETDNSGGRYRLGCVVTGDFHDPANPDFIQQNTCNFPTYGAYYYLPSKIIPALMRYEDVSLTSEYAFGGIDGSLPDVLMPGATYEVAVDEVLPEIAAGASGLRLVAFVLDSQTGEVLNADELLKGETPQPPAGVSGVENGNLRIACGSHGDIRIAGLRPGESFSAEVFSAAGSRIWSLCRMAESEEETLSAPLAGGLYVVRIRTPHEGASVRMIVK